MEKTTAPSNPPSNPIDLMEYLNVLKANLIWIVLCTVLFGIGSYAYTKIYVTPIYQASIRMIVNSKADNNATYTVSDVTSAEKLVATYSSVIKSNRVMKRVIQELNLNMSWVTVNRMVTVSPVNSTPVINLVVKCEDPQLAEQIVTTISEIAPAMIVDAVEAGSCKVITDAYCSGVPISPDVQSNVMQGMLIGAALSMAVVVLIHLLNDAIQSEDQLQQLTGFPVLSSIPVVYEEMEEPGVINRPKKRRKK